MTARINELFARIRSKLGMSMPPTLIVSVITPWAESETAMQPDAFQRIMHGTSQKQGMGIPTHLQYDNYQNMKSCDYSNFNSGRIFALFCQKLSRIATLTSKVFLADHCSKLVTMHMCQLALFGQPLHCFSPMPHKVIKPFSLPFNFLV